MYARQGTLDQLSESDCFGSQPLSRGGVTAFHRAGRTRAANSSLAYYGDSGLLIDIQASICRASPVQRQVLTGNELRTSFLKPTETQCKERVNYNDREAVQGEAGCSPRSTPQLFLLLHSAAPLGGNPKQDWASRRHP